MKILLSKYFANLRRALDAIASKIKKIFWYLGENAFLFTLIFVVLSLIFAEILFFSYTVSVNKELAPSVKGAKFQTDIYNEVLKKWQERKNIFESSPGESYLNHFK